MTPFQFRRRLKDKVRGWRQTPVGDHYNPTTERALARLDQAAPGMFQLAAAAAVSTWEVALTDVSRAAREAGVPLAAPLVERLSDGLVPLSEPLGSAGRRYSLAIRAGAKQGAQTKRLGDALDPVAIAVEETTAEMASGWGKMVDYLAPALEELGVTVSWPEDGLAAPMREIARSHREALELVGQAVDPEAALLGALEETRSQLGDLLERFLYDRRSELVLALESRT